MTKCKSCGADIVWIKTRAGKSMPCDAQRVVYWVKSKAKGKVVTPNGEVVSCEFEGKPEKAAGLGRIPHWGACPGATNHKKKEGQDA